MVDRLTSTVEPASTCSAVAGRSTVTVTGDPLAGRFVSRMGATAPPASVRVPPSDTLASERVQHRAVIGGRWWTSHDRRRRRCPGADGIGMADTVTVIRGVPVTTVSSANGADSNRAVWPGSPPRKVDSAVEARLDRPGSVEIPAGDAPGGFTTNCGSPVTATGVRGVLVPSVRPG